MRNKKQTSLLIRGFLFRLISKLPRLKKCPTIFCYHSVSDDGWTFSVSKEDFDLQVKELLKTKKIVSLGSLLNKKVGYSGNNVAITFDDGYEDVFTSAYPILEKHDLTACVFISGYVSDKDNYGYIDGRKLLSLEQILNLKKAGWEIGFHTKSHECLKLLNSRQLVVEVNNNKKELEEKLGNKIEYFSYPYGLFNKQTLDAVREAKYKYAFTVDGGGVNLRKSPYRISRVLLDKYIKTKDLEIITSCQGLIFNKFLTFCFQVKDYLFPVVKHEG